MTDAATVITDETVKHRVGLGRYSTTVVRKILALLNRVDADVLARILALPEGSDLTANELQHLLSNVRQVQADGWVLIARRLESELADLSGNEAAFNVDLVEFAASRVGVELQSMSLTGSQVYAAAMARPFQGKLLREWLADADEASARRVREVIRQGYAESQTIAQMAQRLRGTRAAQYSDGILEISRRGAEAMVRTAVTHVSNVAAQDSYQTANDLHPGLVTGVQWVSVLDSRTTIICAELDGKVFPLDSGPRPPRHINCRSAVTPILRGMNSFQRETYPEWLGRQPAAVQDDVLGATRARLFRSGALKLDRFVDSKGKVLTLDQLRAKDSAAFAKAGL